MADILEKNSPRERKILIYAGILGIVMLALDLGTKFWVVKCFQLHESIELIPGVLAFTSVRNYGAAWSILSGYGWLLLSFAMVTAVLLCIFFRKITEGWMERYFALALLLSGIIGNSADRFFRGAVVDFIHVHWHNVWHYPVFNVADIAICCGVGIFILSNLLRKNPGESEK